MALAPLASSAEDPFDIAVIAPLTGPSAFLGKEEANALEVLQGVVNKSGGVRGRQIWRVNIRTHEIKAIGALTGKNDDTFCSAGITDQPHITCVELGKRLDMYNLDLVTGTTSGPEMPQAEMEQWQEKRNAVNRYFASLGYTNIKHMSVGIAGWKAAGMKTEPGS